MDEVPLKSIKGGVHMDVTDKYISLASKGVEIQDMLHRGIRLYGTPHWSDGLVIRVFGAEAFYFAGFNEARKETVWLPTQEQLQCLITPKKPDWLLTIFSRFFMFKEVSSKDDYIKYFSSIEQLYFAFVMIEKFGKKWDGSRWIK